MFAILRLARRYTRVSLVGSIIFKEGRTITEYFDHATAINVKLEDASRTGLEDPPLCTDNELADSFAARLFFPSRGVA